MVPIRMFARIDHVGVAVEHLDAAIALYEQTYGMELGHPAAGNQAPGSAQGISFGFQASPPLAARVSDDELSRLHDALGGEGWHELSAEYGTIKLSLAHVLWLRVERDEQRVGFGLSSL